MINPEFFSPDPCHEEAIKLLKPELAFREDCDFAEYQATLRAKFLELIGEMPAERVPTDVRVDFEKDMGDFIEKRFVFTTEKYADVPCHLWIPKDGKEKHMMNGLEWLPIYFGILKTGALAVPLNFRYSADEIEYCVNLAEADVLVFSWSQTQNDNHPTKH